MNLFAQVKVIAMYRRIFNKEGPIDPTLYKMCEKSTFVPSKGTVSFGLNHNDGALKITRTDELGSAPGPDVSIELDMSVLGLDHSKMSITEEDSVNSAWYQGPLGKMETEPEDGAWYRGPLRRTDGVSVDEFIRRERIDQ
jgi:hypothetical protein